MTPKLKSLFEDEPYNVDFATVEPDQSFAEMGLDSLDIATLLHEVETAFDVNIPMETASSFRSARDIDDYLGSIGAS